MRRTASGHLYAEKAEISKCDMMAGNGVVLQVLIILDGDGKHVDGKNGKYLNGKDGKHLDGKDGKHLDGKDGKV